MSLIHANGTETSAAEVVCAASPDQTLSIQSIIRSLSRLCCFTKSLSFLFYPAHIQIPPVYALGFVSLTLLELISICSDTMTAEQVDIF